MIVNFHDGYPPWQLLFGLLVQSNYRFVSQAQGLHLYLLHERNLKFGMLNCIVKCGIVEAYFLSIFAKFLIEFWDISPTFPWEGNSFVFTESPSLEILFVRLALGWTFSNWLQILSELEEKSLCLCLLITLPVAATLNE